MGEQARSLIAVRDATEHDTRVYLARKATGLSGRAMAERIGISKDAYARAESGQRVSPATAALVARALGLEVTDMATLVDEREAA
jgi:transcriptional regulator with XRE-family HTH domain